MTSEEKNSLLRVSALLKIPSKWLENLINFESNFDPLARNKYSGARGLIQFMPSTASTEFKMVGATTNNTGQKTAADTLIERYPDTISQLEGPVYQYLKKYMPFDSAQSLYMAVFYPKARQWSKYTPFPENVQKSNPGLVTVADYINKVEKKALKYSTVIIAVGIVIFLILKKGAA